MDCEHCKHRRYCQAKPDYFRRRFFGMGDGTHVSCGDFEPVYYRGIEGVAA